MFNLILVIFSFQSIFSLNSEDLCSSLTCKGKHRYQCSTDLCGLNAKTCDNYYKFKRFHLSNSLYAFRKFKKNLNACESNELSNKNDYCLNNSKCFKSNADYHLINFFLEVRISFSHNNLQVKIH